MWPRLVLLWIFPLVSRLLVHIKCSWVFSEDFWCKITLQKKNHRGWNRAPIYRTESYRVSELDFDCSHNICIDKKKNYIIFKTMWKKTVFHTLSKYIIQFWIVCKLLFNEPLNQGITYASSWRISHMKLYTLKRVISSENIIN